MPNPSVPWWPRADIAVFPGRLEKEHLSIGERAMVTAMRAPLGDFRDWDMVRAWAEEIAAALAHEAGALAQTATGAEHASGQQVCALDVAEVDGESLVVAARRAPRARRQPASPPP